LLSLPFFIGFFGIAGGKLGGFQTGAFIQLVKVRISEVPKTFSYTTGAGGWRGIKSIGHSHVPAIPIRSIWRAFLCSGLD